MGDIIQLTPQLRVLLIEDNESDAAWISELLESGAGSTIHVTHAKYLSAAIRTLSEQYHAVLLDISLPDAGDLDGFFTVQNLAPTVPVIILTGHNDEKLALKAVESGAQDYLVKDTITAPELIRAVRYAMQRKRFEDGITKQANFDSLTGLANRPLFEHRLETALARIQRSLKGVGLLFIDLNDFKNVNDTLGHAAGDMLLKEIGARMAQCIRPYDTVARLGGDEFAVLIEDIDDAHDCANVAQKLINTVSKPVSMDMRHISVGASIGISTCRYDDNAAADLLMRQADAAMYRAKENNINNYCFYTSDMDEALRLRKQMGQELAEAVRMNQLTLCYQPKQSLESGDVIGVEALVRWDHPRLGTLLPHAFLSLAKEIHMLEEIEGWVLAQVCKDMQRWREMCIPKVQVAVNISKGQFDSPTFIVMLMSLIDQHNIDPNQLTLELPEEVFSPTDPSREHTFSQLFKLGIAIAMDKFGGHMSSLQSLKGIALSELKFDSKFTQSASGQAEDVRLVKAIIACAHALGIKVVASCVESDDLRASLRQQHCDAIQGFVYSKPMPADYLEKWLQAEMAASNLPRQSAAH